MSGKPSVFPVSEAMMLPVGALVQPLVDVLVAIDSVHSDGRLPATMVRLVPLRDEEGYYEFLPPHGIVISESALHSMLTFAHEVGHAIDLHGLGDGQSLASMTFSMLADWRQAIQASDSYRAIMTLQQRFARDPAGPHLAYLLHPGELWARSYAQFIATTSGVKALCDELDERRIRQPGTVYIPYQWDDNEFRPIEREITTLFRLKAWMA